MDYEDDFIDGGNHPLPVGDGGNPESLTAKPFNLTWLSDAEFRVGEQNARWFKAVFDSLGPNPQRPVRIYLPEGRYYLGLPVPAMDQPFQRVFEGVRFRSALAVPLSILLVET